MDLKLVSIHKNIDTKTILEAIDIAFKPGIYTLLGINGAGKSTLLDIIATIIPPTDGEILYKGHSIRKKPQILRQVLGYMPQNVGLIQDFNLEQNLYYLGMLKGVPAHSIKTRAPQLLEVLNLQAYRKSKIFNLSGGVRQRIGVALALINQPEVLILDEPVNNLDQRERIRFYELIKGLAKDCIIIISTHLVQEIAPYTDECIVLKAGRIVYQSSFRENTRLENASAYGKDLEAIFKTYA